MSSAPRSLRPGLVERVGVTCFRRRWRVLALAVATLVVLSGAAAVFGDEFRQSFAMPGTETQAAADLLDDAGFEGAAGHRGLLVVHADDVTAPGVRRRVEGLLDDIGAGVDGVTVASPYEEWAAHQVSDDATVAYATLDFGDVPRSEAEEAADEVRRLRDAAPRAAGETIELGGELFYEEADFASSGVGLLAAGVILLVAFGSVLAMGLPIGTALIGIGCGFAVVQFATRVLDIPPFTPSVVAMIGLGAGIDYALLIVTRYREEIAGGHGIEAAVARAMATAGRATVLAGATVVTSLLGLLLVGLDDVRALALAAAAGVLFVMLASVTVLPALLGVVGARIDRFGLPHRRRLAADDPIGTRWYRWSRWVQRRPAPTAGAAVLLLLVLAAPLGDLRLGMADASSRPESDTSRRAHDLVADGFGAGANGPLLIAVDLPATAPETVLAGLTDALAAEPGVAEVSPPITDAADGTALVQVIAASGPQAEETSELVRRLRVRTVPAALDGTGASAWIGGATAGAVDFADHNAAVLPWFVAAVMALAFGLLTVVFRSVLVPLKAVAVNLLTVGAAYGVIVAVFQWGWLGTWLGLGQPGPIEAWVPMMLFAIVFGLSIDYEVFLMSRVRERFVRTGDSSESVAYGLARTGRLITAAAAIMICVFGAFALADERALQIFGVGMAAALAVDATLVRLVLVPASMQLLGQRNWWLPGWLHRMLPQAALADQAGPDEDALEAPPIEAGTR